MGLGVVYSVIVGVNAGRYCHRPTYDLSTVGIVAVVRLSWLTVPGIGFVLDIDP